MTAAEGHPAPPAVGPLRFHWSISSVTDPTRRSRQHDTLAGIPDFAAHVDFCGLAAAAGIDSVLLAVGLGRPEPFTWAAALAAATERVRFMCAIRPGLIAPAFFVQQVNTAAALTGGRICLNAVVGHSPENRAFGDVLDHDVRYARADEFWRVCHQLWSSDEPVTFRGSFYTLENLRMRTRFAGAEGRSHPEIYFGGNSPQAEQAAANYGSCLLQLPRTPDAMVPSACLLAPHGVDLGMHVSLMLRPTHAEAVTAAGDLVAGLSERSRAVHRGFRGDSDSIAYQTVYALGEASSTWVTPHLWSGAVPYLGAPAIAFVGGPTEITDAIWAYRTAGVAQFMFAGWPDHETLELFAAEVVPALRRREAAEAAAAAGQAG